MASTHIKNIKQSESLALRIAVSARHNDIAKILFVVGFDANACQGQLLLWAVDDEDVEMTRLLLEAGRGIGRLFWIL